MARVGGVGADERGGGLVERFRGVGLFHRVIADGVRIEFALNDCRAGWRFGKEIGPAVAGAANTNGKAKKRRIIRRSLVSFQVGGGSVFRTMRQKILPYVGARDGRW